MALSFETSKTLNPTRLHNIPEDSNLQQHHHRNPKHHTLKKPIIHQVRGKKTKPTTMRNFSVPLLQNLNSINFIKIKIKSKL
jgi:hypothetical protein